MQIQQLNKGLEPDRVMIVVKNVDGSGSITTGLGVAFPGSGASIDGIGVVKHTAALTKGFAGIAAGDIPINGVGLATVWGYAASVQISNVGTSITITAGDILRPGAVAGTFFSGQANGETLSTLLYRYVYAANSNTISAQAWVPGIVKVW